MLKIDGKERVFSTTFLMKPGETVVLQNAVPGAEVKFMTQPKLAQSSNPKITATVNDNIINVTLPYPISNAMGVVFDEERNMASGPEGSLAGRIAVQLLGNVSIVTFEVCFDRSTGLL